MDREHHQAPRLFPFRPTPLPPPIDCLIVLGSRLNHQGEPGRVAKHRLRHALQLWRDQPPGCRFLITGGRWPGSPASEARAMADWALDWVAEHWGAGPRAKLASCLLLEEVSRNTAASAANTLPLVQGLNRRAVGLVSDTMHMRRAFFLFKRHYGRRGIAVRPLPARGLLRHYWKNRRYLWLTKMALREGGAWLKLLVSLPFRGRGRK